MKLSNWQEIIFFNKKKLSSNKFHSLIQDSRKNPVFPNGKVNYNAFFFLVRKHVLKLKNQEVTPKDSSKKFMNPYFFKATSCLPYEFFPYV